MNTEEKTGIRKVLRIRRAMTVAVAIVVVGATAMLLRAYFTSEDDHENTNTYTKNVPTIPCASPVPITVTPNPLEGFLWEEADYPYIAKIPKEEDYLRSDGSLDQVAYLKDYQDWEKSDYYFRKDIKYDAVTKAEKGLAMFSRASLPILLEGEAGTNRTCSPLNIYLALGMLAQVTDGSTRSQVLRILGTDDVKMLREMADAAWKIAYKNDGQVSCLLAESLWLRESEKIIPYEPNPLVLLRDCYHASTFRGRMGTEEYNQALRTWINEQTGGLLKDPAEKLGFSEETRLALATTVYFRARWSSEFAKSATDLQVFHTSAGDKETEFMHGTAKRRYYDGDTFRAVTYDFDGNHAGDMVFFLPDEGVDVNELLTDVQVLSLLGSGLNIPQSKMVAVQSSVPKFDVLSDNLDLTQCMKDLGIKEVFEPGVADFSALLAEPVGAYLKGAMHSARVKIDEEGVEAAAYTVLTAFGAAPSEPDEIVDFVLDRPFLFAIRTENGMPLFVGVVENP